MPITPSPTIDTLKTAALSGDWHKINLNSISKDILEGIHTFHYTYPSELHGYCNATFVGMAARSGKLKKFPKELITAGGLTTPNSDGQNALHIAAETGELKHIPENMMSIETLFKELILLVKEPLQKPLTPFHIAIKYNHLDQIPKKFLTEETLSKEDSRGMSSLDFAILAEKSNWVPKFIPNPKPTGQIKTILGVLKNETLKEYLRCESQNPYREQRHYLVKNELVKRKVLEKLKKDEQSLEI